MDQRWGEEPLAFGPGEVYHEAVETVMQARNPSTTTETEAYIFQVGDLCETLMMPNEVPPSSWWHRTTDCLARG